MICSVIHISNYIQVNMSDVLLNFFQLIPIIGDDVQALSKDKSCLVDLYNKVKYDKTKINNQMRQKIFIPCFKEFESMLPYKGKKYSLFKILKIYSIQSNFEYTQYFKVEVKETQKYFKIVILKNNGNGDKIKIKLNDIT